MKITHVIPCIDISSGGPSRSSTNLIKSLVKIDKNVFLNLITMKTENPILLKFNNSRSNLILCSRNFLSPFKNLKKNLKASNTDIFHAHAIWKLEIHYACKVAQMLNIPYVISTRGMLESWSLSQSFFLKKISMIFYQRSDLQKASCIHATAQSEANNIRALGFKNPIAIIPNGINLEEFPSFDKKQKNKRRVLFLSRIHKKKGIENLIYAWKKIDKSITENWIVEIVGDGDKNYIFSLKKLILKLNLKSQIFISDPLYGKEKIKKFQESDLFVLPTFSENFGIVVAEALASFLPVITTKGAPWKELISNECGDWIDIGEKPLINSLSKMLLKSNEELHKMGLNGRMLVEEKYSMTSTASSMNELYKWLLSNGPMPKFVDLNL